MEQRDSHMILTVPALVAAEINRSSLKCYWNCHGRGPVDVGTLHLGRMHVSSSHLILAYSRQRVFFRCKILVDTVTDVLINQISEKILGLVALGMTMASCAVNGV